MKLIELQPRWLNPNVLAFLCPHCQKFWLTCKNIVLSSSQQFDLYQESFGDDWNMLVVPCREEFCWTFSSADFNSLSVSPSVDASNSGHWHGSIINGEAV